MRAWILLPLCLLAVSCASGPSLEGIWAGTLGEGGAMLMEFKPGGKVRQLMTNNGVQIDVTGGYSTYGPVLKIQQQTMAIEGMKGEQALAVKKQFETSRKNPVEMNFKFISDDEVMFTPVGAPTGQKPITLTRRDSAPPPIKP